MNGANVAPPTVHAPRRQAITTRFLGPTDHRPARVVARCDGGRVVLSWDHGKSSGQNHADAAWRLAFDLGWSGTWQGGALPNGHGYAFVWTGPTT